MEKSLFTIITLFFCFSSVFAQEKIELAEIDMSNLGDTQMYANKRDDAKTPLEGKIRIITGFTTEYIDANFKKGYAEGKWEYYRENKLHTTINFKDGYQEGAFCELYPGGEVKIKGQYIKGQKEGKWETFKSDGIIKLTEEFSAGSLTKKITYFTDGKVEIERNYKNGKEHGQFRQYTFQGELKMEKNYVNGKQVGKQIQYWDSNADNYVQTANYNENGMLDGDYTELYTENNAVKVKGKYSKGRKIGKWIYGYTHQLYKEETYEDGKLVETTKLNK